MRATRATTVALVVSAFLGGLAQPASADDPISDALRRKEELARAVQVSRALVIARCGRSGTISQAMPTRRVFTT